MNRCRKKLKNDGFGLKNDPFSPGTISEKSNVDFGSKKWLIYPSLDQKSFLKKRVLLNPNFKLKIKV